jgi:hypothetical protein
MTNISLLIALWYHVTVPYRIVVEVIHVTLIITCAAADVFPKTPRPNASFLLLHQGWHRLSSLCRRRLKPVAIENNPWRATPYDL